MARGCMSRASRCINSVMSTNVHVDLRRGAGVKGAGRKLVLRICGALETKSANVTCLKLE